MAKNASETLATLVYLGNHNNPDILTCEEWAALDPVKAYKIPVYHGPAMSLVKDAFRIEFNHVNLSGFWKFY